MGRKLTSTVKKSLKKKVPLKKSVSNALKMSGNSGVDETVNDNISKEDNFVDNNEPIVYPSQERLEKLNLDKSKVFMTVLEGCINGYAARMSIHTIPTEEFITAVLDLTDKICPEE